MSPNNHYRTPFHCPCCHRVISILSHSEPNPIGVMVSATLADARAIHAKAYSLCALGEDWARGWVRGQTVDVTAATETSLPALKGPLPKDP